jgi:hypothetical protein
MASELGDAPDMRDNERRNSFYNRYFVFKKVRSIDNAELVVKSLLGTSTAFEKQMAALEQDQDQAELATVIAPNAAAKAAKAAKVAKKPVAAAAEVAAAAIEKKKPGKTPKIQLIVKEQTQ